jgi:two-component system, NtrC family, sensor histidine kinase HydH
MQDSERQRLLDRYAEIAQLAGGLAHEIRNPLSTIGINLELLVADLEEGDAPRDRRMLQKIRTVQQQCDALEEVLNAFLRFVSLGEFDTEPTDLNAVVEEFVAFDRAQSDRHAIDVTTHLATDLPLVALDAALMRQVLTNLARNAREAMPAGGPLEVQTRSDNGRVILEVIDGGTGMSETTRVRIFNAFFSTRAGGSGLGLPTVRRIVEAHGGTITCDSEPARGTRFTISLPPCG